MGNTIQAIRNNSSRKNSSVLLTVKFSKLRDFHASFKSICDNFSIGLDEFEHIFGARESDFVIWDSDNNGLIDSLELFSGISLLSDTKFQDKVRFLFDIFDFNESEVLSLLDVEFMVYCCISSNYKIFSITSQVDTQQVTNFVSSNFGSLSQITVADLITITRGNQQIKRFLDITKSNKPSPNHKEL